MLGVAACATAPVTALPENVKWVDHPVFTGVKQAVLHGNPSQAGPFVVRLWFPANYQIPPHFHPVDENVTIVSGSVNLGHGDRFDKSQAKRYVAGEFFRVSAQMRHYGFTSEECVLQVHSVGPTGYTQVNPADKPGKMM
ncbi:MAG: cupin domain-containing protein [Candidatus Rokuibacteriota bacterium]